MITVEEAETNIMEPLTESAGEETPSVQEMSPNPTPPTPEAQSTEDAQEEVVQRRNMSSEKKKLRRIRTNSKVESVI